jgi:hypothetical protein
MFRFLPALGAVVASAALVLTGSPAVADPGPSAPAEPAGQLAQLLEFRTAGNAGWFYTLKESEASDAVSKFKFTKSASVGKLYTSAVPGGVAVHRLRMKTGGPSYLLSVSPTEIRDPRFQDEGVLGYIDNAEHPGETKLIRFSNHGKWRVLADGPANINNMKAAGYQVDGPLGWYHP